MSEVVRRWQRYPAYKACALDWSKDIPNHWTLAALKRLARFQSGDGITSQAA
jgi:hypothetical protein